jgi:hypothetical protein
MATYLQGVTDYIPQIQPFKPDLNFYQGVLETKQAQYQAGYDKISNLYGTLLNSELSRGDNIERRDEFFNKIQTEIQKISGLDLSRSENINAARKVFQPLVDDKYILRDMSFSKSYRDEQGKAEYFLNCTDEKKCGGKYWEGGVRALDYQRQDFIDASIEESMGVQNAQYTPYVNTYEKAMNFAKEMGFNIKTIDFSPDGRYRIQTKNGPAMVTGLTDAFVRLISSDPAAQAMYNTQAYLQRKDYTFANADKFGGDKTAAEKEYLFNQAKTINENMLKIKQQSEKDLSLIKAQEKVAEEVVKTTPLNSEIDAGFIAMMNGLPEEAANAQATNEVATQALSSTDGIDYQNMSISALRSRIDAATANTLLFDDMAGTAESYAMNTMEQEITEDKYALAQFEHGLRMSEIAYKDALEGAREDKKKKKEEDEEAAIAAAYSTGDGTEVTGGQQATSTEFDMMSRLQTVASENRQAHDNALTQRNALIKDFLTDVANNPASSPEQRQVAQASLKSMEGSGAKGLFEQIKSIMDMSAQIAKSGKPLTEEDRAMFKEQILGGTSENQIKNLILTSGNGLWVNSQNLNLQLATLQGEIEQSKQLIAAQDQADKENNMAIRARMIADGVEDVDIFFNEDGSKKSSYQFRKDWIKKHPTKASWVENPMNLVGAVGDAFGLNDAEDDYEELEEKYKETFNSGKVSLRTPYGSLGGDGEQGLAVTNKTWTVDPAAVETMTTEDGRVVLTGNREKLRELYATDLKKALSDMSSGNNKVLIGNVSTLDSDALEEDDDAGARSVLNEILRDAFTTKYKAENADRPVMDVTRAGIIAGDPDKVGVTFKISEAYIKKNAGSAKDPGFSRLLKNAEKGVSNEITVIMDRNSVKSGFFKELEGSPVERLFNLQGSITLNAYEKQAGTIKITRGADGMIYTSGNLKSYDPETGQFVPLQGPNGELPGINDVFPGDQDINSLVERLNYVALEQARANIARTKMGIAQ